jgi:hypothetical protein
MVKNRFRRRMIYRPQALHATQIMDTVHQQDLTAAYSGTEWPDLATVTAQRPLFITARNGESSRAWA